MHQLYRNAIRRHQRLCHLTNWALLNHPERKEDIEVMLKECERRVVEMVQLRGMR